MEDSVDEKQTMPSKSNATREAGHLSRRAMLRASGALAALAAVD